MRNNVDNKNDGIDDDVDFEYQYHHGTGEHVLVKKQRRDGDGRNRPTKYYSVQCILCHCVDGICWIIVLGFLIFSFWLCYYIYNNYNDGGG